MDYSPIAGDYERIESGAKTLWKLGYAPVSRLILPVEKKNILDYGCGTGIFCRYLHSLGAMVTGVDISQGMIGEAKRNSPDNITYRVVGSGDLGEFPKNSFDNVVSNFVLCAIKEEESIRKILQEIFRVLKNDGAFIMMNSHWEKSNGKEFVSFKLEWCDNLVSGQPIRAITKSDPPIVFEDYFRSVTEYRSLLESAGFTMEAAEEPLASQEETNWIDEQFFPPYYIIKSRKNPAFKS